MDERLKERLKKLHDQIEILEKSEHKFLHLEAHKKVLFAKLYQEAPGKSIADKEAWARSQEQWTEYVDGLSVAQSDFNKQYRLYELYRKAYDAEHLTYKIEESAIKRSN